MGDATYDWFQRIKLIVERTPEKTVPYLTREEALNLIEEVEELRKELGSSDEFGGRTAKSMLEEIDSLKRELDALKQANAMLNQKLGVYRI